jgi:hypothetical protein
MRLRLWPNGPRDLRWDFQTLFRVLPSAATTSFTWKMKVGLVVLINYATNYLYIEDPGGPDMTDGCGFVNKFTLKTLRELLQWDTVPTAIQCRIAGAKVKTTDAIS